MRSCLGLERGSLIGTYHSEFLTTLVNQAVDKKDRYLPVYHKLIKPGDVVLLVETHQKRYHYPMARVCEVETNSLGEVTSAYVFKGATREKVYRHVTSLILLLSSDGFVDSRSDSKLVDSNCDSTSANLQSSRDRLSESASRGRVQPRRVAAEACRSSLKRLLSDE